MRIQKYMMALIAILSVIFFTSIVMAGPAVNGSGANGMAVNACSLTDKDCL